MTLPNDNMQELCDLLWKVRDGSCQPEDIKRLEQLAGDDPDIQKLCARFAVMCGLLHWSRRRPRESGAVTATAAMTHHVASPPLGFLGSAMHGTLSYFSQIGPLSYLIATFIMLVMGVVASNWKLSDYSQIVHETPAPAAARLLERDSQMKFVGRITGMVDCQWSDESMAAFNGAHVPLGRKYALASGLMEITYDTGAKVILQGPCTYEVESKDGGYLSVGKLTARLEKKEEGSKQTGDRNESQRALTLALSQGERGPSQRAVSQGERGPDSRSSFLIPHSYFAVRTPTAVVTDLGTEFGVEVSKEGYTTSHVFRGTVEVQATAKNGKPHGRSVRLIENESVHIDKQHADTEISVQRGKNDAAAFVRAEQFLKLASENRLRAFRRWQTHSQELRRDPSLLAHYDFQQWDGHPSVLSNVAANGDRTLDGVVWNATWANGRTTGKHALLFQNLSDHVAIDLPNSTGVLTVAAWVSIDALDKSFQSLLASNGWGTTGRLHWHLLADGRMEAGICGDTVAYQSDPLPNSVAMSGRWTHLALVMDQPNRRATFFRDGRPVGSRRMGEKIPICIGPAWIGAWNAEGKSVPEELRRDLRGRIDELVIMGRALSDQEILEMYEAGKP